MISAGALIGAFISMALGIAGLAVSSAKDQQNIDMVHEENAIEREREDTTFQRKKEDAIQAGYSPLAVVNATTNPARVNVPQSSNPVGLGLQNLGLTMSQSFSNFGNTEANVANVEGENKYREEICKIRNGELQFNYDKLSADQKMFAMQLASDEEINRIINDTKSDIAKKERDLAWRLAEKQQAFEDAMAQKAFTHDKQLITARASANLRLIDEQYKKASELSHQNYKQDSKLSWQRTAQQAITLTVDNLESVGMQALGMPSQKRPIGFQMPN